MTTKQQVRERQGNRSLLQIALDLHMGIHGSYDYSHSEMEYDFETIRMALECWEPTLHVKNRLFDDSVQHVLGSVMYEAVAFCPQITGNFLTR